MFSDEKSPIDRFSDWMKEAEKSEPNDANAVCLSTCVDNRPSARMVLLKAVDEDGFVIYTNMESQKGEALKGNPQAALTFHWKTTHKQVRVEGPIEMVADDEADSYFASREWKSRIGAWASKQSRPLDSRYALEKRVAEYIAKYPMGDVPRPPYWSGFRVKPDLIEFWHDRPFRLHDRIVYKKQPDGTWDTQRLFP